MILVYEYRVIGRACENFGAVDYTTKELLDFNTRTATATTKGYCEGERVNNVESWIIDDHVTPEGAHAYRVRSGYTTLQGPDSEHMETLNGR